MTFSPFRRAFAASLVALLAFGATPAPAQDEGDNLPSELLDNLRRQQGDKLLVCIDNMSVGAALDEAVMRAIADALLLDVEFVPAPNAAYFPLSGGGFLQEIRVALNNNCDIVAGWVVQPDPPYSNFAQVTRPYVTIPFVLAVTDPDFTSLTSIPHDRLLGTALGSLGERAYIIWQQQVPASEAWLRLPYADASLMLQRLRDGKIAGMIIWEPWLVQLTNGDPAEAGVQIVPMDPVPQEAARIGALVSSRDTFLRNAIDEAITSLTADGTLTRLLEEFHYSGVAGG